MARPAEKSGPTIIRPPNPFGTIHLLTCLSESSEKRIIVSKRTPQGCDLAARLQRELHDAQEKIIAGEKGAMALSS